MDLNKIKALLKEVIKTGDEELIEMVTSILVVNLTFFEIEIKIFLSYLIILYHNFYNMI